MRLSNEEKWRGTRDGDRLPVVISSPWRFTEGNSQKEGAISWYVRWSCAESNGSCNRGSQMRGKGNHNFQLFLSYSWSLHHADNIVLYSRARCFLVPSFIAIFSHCHYLRTSRWLYIQQRQLPIFHPRAFFPRVRGAFITNVTTDLLRETRKKLSTRSIYKQSCVFVKIQIRTSICKYIKK